MDGRERIFGRNSTLSRFELMMTTEIRRPYKMLVLLIQPGDTSPACPQKDPMRDFSTETQKKNTHKGKGPLHSTDRAIFVKATALCVRTKIGNTINLARGMNAWKSAFLGGFRENLGFSSLTQVITG